MKKLLHMIISTLILLQVAFPVYAESHTISATIPVKMEKSGGIVTLEPLTPESGTAQRMEIPDGKSGEFKIDYKDPGNFEYKVTQIPINPKAKADETVYKVYILISYDSSDKLFATVVAQAEGGSKGEIVFKNEVPEVTDAVKEKVDEVKEAINNIVNKDEPQTPPQTTQITPTLVQPPAGETVVYSKATGDAFDFTYVILAGVSLALCAGGIWMLKKTKA